MTRRQKIALMGGVVTFCVAAFLVSPWRIYYNGTPSLPLGLYLLDKSASPIKGELTMIRYKEPKWAKEMGVTVPDGLPLLKKVRAVAGDKLIHVKNKIYRCNPNREAVSACKVIGVRLPDGYKGYVFPSPNLPLTVPEGYVYLGSDYDKGWDSRYLGLFPVRDLMGKAQKLDL